MPIKRRRRKTQDVFARVMSHVNKAGPDGCWLWTALTTDGYGRVKIGRNEQGNIRAHVACYELHKGAIPPGMVLDHLCRNPACVNPDHLEPVMQAVNCRRGKRAKLTEWDVAEMRAMVLSGATHAAVADVFGVGRSYVWLIMSGRRWKRELKPAGRTQSVLNAVARGESCR